MSPLRPLLIVTAFTGLALTACGGDDASPPPGGSSGSGGSGTATGGSSAATGGSGTATGGSAGTTTGTGGSAGTGEPRVFDAGSDPARNRVQPGQVCDRLATIQCAGERYCCDNPGRSLEQCKQAQLSECASLYFDQVSQDPITGYSVTAAEAAFTEFERLASECDPDIAAWSLSPAGLRGVTLGTIAANQACTPADVTNFPKVAAHLASCLNPATHACLPTGLTGMPPLDPWNCTARGGSGAPCFSDLNCIEGLYCNNDVDSPRLVGSQCLARKANGTSCGFPNECVSLTCRGGTCIDATEQTAYCLAP
jgi:hypothetical protein